MSRACLHRSQALGLLLLLLLPACAQVKAIVRPSPFDFGGVRATVRDFPPGALCEAEPRFLIDELSSVNGLLSGFLAAVPSRPGEPWKEAAISLLEEAGSRLPPLLQLHTRSLNDLAVCPFAKQGAWPSLSSRGRALVEETRQRLETAPEEVNRGRREQALQEWRKQRLVQQEAARRACPQRPGRAIVSFAWREGVLTTWLFCDGAQVTREGQRRPELESAPDELLRGRRPSEGAYFSAVGSYPSAAVVAPPGEEALSVW